MYDDTHGAMPGKVTRKSNGKTSEKAPGACDSEGLDNTTTHVLEFPTAMRHGKDEATQIAELALAGHVVHKGRSGDYLVCKYGLTRHCKDLDELQLFARKLGVRAD